MEPLRPFDSSSSASDGEDDKLLVAARSSASFISTSNASSSASGESGIVSSEEIDGERERVDVGVEGDEEFAEEYAEGIKGSLTRYEGGGEGCESVGDEGKNPPLPRGTPKGD